MKKLVLIGLMMMGAQAFAGGGSGAGPCGPDCQAQQYFEKSVEVQTDIIALQDQGYTIPLEERNVNLPAGYLNCGKPTPEATWTGCDRIYVFTRAFARSDDINEIKTVTAIVKMDVHGFKLNVVNGAKK